MNGEERVGILINIDREACLNNTESELLNYCTREGCFYFVFIFVRNEFLSSDDGPSNHQANESTEIIVELKSKDIKL